MTRPNRASSRPLLRRPGLTILITLALALLLEGWAARRARACGEPEIDYGADAPVLSEHRGQQEIGLNFRRKEHSFSGGNLNFSEVKVFTRDKGLARWLEKHGMGEELWTRLKAASAKTSCVDLLYGRRIAKLEEALGAQVAEAYRRGARRAPPRLQVMLIAEVLDQSEPSCSPPAP
ncbi:MAG: hypothetical protein RBU30_15575 [Polyangia bacterium]|jgi:hypothetical protein|nr:hypothetical protein [Polyangia bacterium]